jgi:hypothetical protein
MNGALTTKLEKLMKHDDFMKVVEIEIEVE